MQLTRKNVSYLLRCVLLVEMSLVGALTLRFLWLSRGRTPLVFSSYLSSLYYSFAAIRNSLLPTLLLGSLFLFLHSRLQRRGALSSEILGGIVALTGFYMSMGALSLLLGQYMTFPRLTWIAAWGIAVLSFVFVRATQHLESVAREGSRKRPWHMFMDGLITGVALWFAYMVRFDASIPPVYVQQFAFLVVFSALVYVGSNYFWDVYSQIWRFTSLKEMMIIAQAVASAAAFTLLARVLLLEHLPVLRVPLGVLAIHPVSTFVGMLSIRSFRRLQRQYRPRHASHEKPLRTTATRRVLLIGAGQAGQQLVRELESQQQFDIVGFLDDDPIKLGRRISGVRVLGDTKSLPETVRSRKIDEVILAMPSAPSSTIKQIVGACEQMDLPALTVPGLTDIVQRRVSVSRLRSVRMEDLLGRAAIHHGTYDPDLAEAYSDQDVLVTGAAGSIGSELVRQLKEFLPSNLLMLDKDENGIYEIHQEVRDQYEGSLKAIVADVRDRERMEAILGHYRPAVIFHAAAFKHVPLMEEHPSEAIINNVVGTRNLVDLAARYETEAFVLISTDKAVNPSSVMGASKRIGEIIVQRMARKHPTTRFCCVRFGNVLGSRASVVPMFRKQIAEGKNLAVTHPDIKRYFMTIPEAVQLLIQAGSLGRHGEVFVLDMGDPIKIADLARDLIELSGLRVGKDIKIEFVGLRPGEKLSEELLRDNEAGIRSTRYPKIMVAEANDHRDDSFDELLLELERAARSDNPDLIRDLLARMEIGYFPDSRQAVGKGSR